MTDLNQDNWSKQLQLDENAVVIDVRTKTEVDEGMIANAIHLDIYLGQHFIDSLEKLDKTKNYYVYCRVGGRSAQACNIMKQLGFNSTYNLAGGLNQWQGQITKP